MNKDDAETDKLPIEGGAFSGWFMTHRGNEFILSDADGLASRYVLKEEFESRGRKLSWSNVPMSEDAD